MELKGDDDSREADKTTFGPVFMSPGGTFVRPSMPALNLTPDASLAIFNEGFSTCDDGGLAPQQQGMETDLKLKPTSIKPPGVSVPPSLEGQSWGVKRGEVQDLGLFGGAIVMTLPSRLEDVSVVRQVPDHQEVFVDKASDISLIVEILSHADEVSNEEAARYHFDDLAQCNSAVSTDVMSTAVYGEEQVFLPGVSPSIIKCVLTGRQKVSKFRNSEQNCMDEVLIFLLVVRMPEIGTDLLISLNVPSTIGSKGDSVSTAHAQKSSTTVVNVPADAFLQDSTVTVGEPTSDAQFGVTTLRMLAASFRIVDYSLFA